MPDIGVVGLAFITRTLSSRGLTLPAHRAVGRLDITRTHLLDHHFWRCHCGITQLVGGGVGQINQPGRVKRPTVVDAHHHRTAIAGVGDAGVAGMGSVGWAAVICTCRTPSPEAVRLPWNFLPYQRPCRGRGRRTGCFRIGLAITVYGRLAEVSKGSLTGTASGMASGCRAGGGLQDRRLYNSRRPWSPGDRGAGRLYPEVDLD